MSADAANGPGGGWGDGGGNGGGNGGGSVDPVVLTADLVRCASVTPEDAGALEVLAARLAPAGFACHLIERGGVRNLYARWGEGTPVFGFAGHTDVVPLGDPAAWSVAPFGAEVRDGRLWGRGACDMKSGVAAFVAASLALVAERPPKGSIALLITGDEEGPAVDGTAAILEWMEDRGERLDACLVGEPTSVERLGDTVKIGRRGSMNARLVVRGRQGHSAYPERALNPLPALAGACARLAGTPLDLGSSHFQPSTLALTTMDVGNAATNVIPVEGRAGFNVRFNDLHTSESIRIWADQQVAAALEGTGCTYDLDWEVSGESFLTLPGPFTEVVTGAVTDRLLEEPVFSTGGGTSDARFLRDHCPVLEFGLVGDTMHQVDESVDIADVRALSQLYRDILERFFGV